MAIAMAIRRAKVIKDKRAHSAPTNNPHPQASMLKETKDIAAQAKLAHDAPWFFSFSLHASEASPPTGHSHMHQHPCEHYEDQISSRVLCMVGQVSSSVD
jgi:hypothetical protein